LRRTRRPGRLLLLFAAAVGLLAARPAAGQEVRFVPRPDRPVERRLHRFLESGRYRLWTRDTVLARGDSVRGPVLVLGATVRSAARIEGDIYVVAGDLFLRPGGRVTGDAVVLGGGWYASSMATVEGEVVYRPNLLLRVARRGGGWEVVSVENVPKPLTFHGFYGLTFPTYDRVEAWTFGWGATARATRMAWQPSLTARVRVHTEGIRALGGSLRQSWYPTGSLRLDLEAERGTLSNEAWIRGDFSNTVAYLSGSGDYRDYYRSDRLSAGFQNTTPAGWQARLYVSREEDRSLPALELPVFFHEDSVVRTNPPVAGGKLWSARASLGWSRRTGSWRVETRAGVEAADSTVAGDFSFLVGEARLSGRTEGIPGVRLDFFALARGDLAGTAPPQRWSAIGGSGTLPTRPTLESRGARLLFGQVTLSVPISGVSVPALGSPGIFVRDAIGSAWGKGESPRFRDNVTVGVRAFLFEAGLALDPSVSDLDPTWVLSVSLPGSARR